MKKPLMPTMLVLLLGLASIARAQTEVTFCAPPGTREVMEQIFSAFESKTGYKVKSTFSAGGELQKQIASGEAVFDVPVMQAPYPKVIASGNVIKSSARTLARVPVGVAVKKGAPRPDISTPEAVRKMLLSASSISSGGSGVSVLVDEMVQKLGISEQLQPKLKHARSSADSVKMAASGEVEIGLTLLSEMEAPGIDVVGPLPKEISSPFILDGFISTHAKNPQAAKALLDYLSSSEAAHVYREHSMIPGP